MSARERRTFEHAKIRARDVFAGQDREYTRRGAGRGRINSGDPGMRVRRPHDITPGDARAGHIVRIATAAGDEPHILKSRNCRTDASRVARLQLHSVHTLTASALPRPGTRSEDWLCVFVAT